MDYEKVLGEHKFPTYEQLKNGLLRLIDEGKISREDAARLLPELRESDGEKIRKGLLTAFQKMNGWWNGMLVSGILTWLEKQKEQKEELVYRLNGLMQEYIKEGKDDEEKEHRLKCYKLFWDALEDANFFEQKEQKPAEWSEQDEEMLDSVIHIITHVDDLAHEPTFAGPKWTHPYSKEIRFLNKLRNRLRNRLFEEND